MDLSFSQILLEAILFAAQKPISESELLKLIPNIDKNDLQQLLQILQQRYSGELSGIHLVPVAGGWQFRTNPVCQHVVLQLYQTKPQRLSRAAIEALAVVAYRQPIVRAQVDEIRGVDSGGVLKTLLEYQLIEVIGKLDEVGRPHLYATTDLFLSTFGLHSLQDLPPISDFKVESLDMLGDDLSSIAQEMELDSIDNILPTESPEKSDS